MQDISRWINGRKLPNSDILFVFFHPNGCNTNELNVQMGMPGRNSGLTLAINRGCAKATMIKGIWVFKQNEIIRILDLHRNWIGLSWLCKQKRYERKKCTIRNYATEGLLGPTCKNLSGYLSILRVVANRMEEVLAIIIPIKERSRLTWSNRKIGQKELSLPVIYERYKHFGLEYGTIKHWAKHRHLPSTKRGSLRIVKANDFQTFAIETAIGANSMRPKYQRVFQKICKEENWI